MNHSTPRPDSTSLPPTFTEETKREFREKFNPIWATDPMSGNYPRFYTHEAIESFLLSRIETAYDLGDKNGYERGIVEESQNCWEHSEKAKAEGRAETLKEVSKAQKEWWDAKSETFGDLDEAEDVIDGIFADLITRLTQ